MFQIHYEVVATLWHRKRAEEMVLNKSQRTHHFNDITGCFPYYLSILSWLNTWLACWGHNSINLPSMVHYYSTAETPEKCLWPYSSPGFFKLLSLPMLELPHINMGISAIPYLEYVPLSTELQSEVAPATGLQSHLSPLHSSGVQEKYRAAALLSSCQMRYLSQQFKKKRKIYFM